MRFSAGLALVLSLTCARTPSAITTPFDGDVSWQGMAAMSTLPAVLRAGPVARDARVDERLSGLPSAQEGQLSLLTYNIAGLPSFLSNSDPVRNIPLIGPMLSDYDLVFIQEDFVHHPLLVRHVDHPYRSAPQRPGERLGMGDGLTRFAYTPFRGLSRHPWVKCHGHLDSGSDCLTAKGFSVAEHEIARGIFINVYNLHMDAGEEPGDIAARRAQVEQLLRHISVHSSGKAVLVIGDTNIGPRDDANLTLLLDEAGLADACRTSSGCRSVHRIDRVLFRGSSHLTLALLDFRVDERFVDVSGTDLSDHKAVGAVFWYRADPTPSPEASLR